jgi:polyisoprenoid-binding protein YceI
MRLLKLALIFLLSNPLFATQWQITEGKINFIALATPGALRIVGKQSDPKALKPEIKLENNRVSGTVAFQIEALTTGIGLRDRHMKENYLETGKFPESVFTYTQVELPKDFQGEKIPFEGKLKLHGVEKPVSGELKIEKEDPKLTLSHEFKIKTRDFGITTPHYMSVTMADEVVIQVTLEGTLR